MPKQLFRPDGTKIERTSKFQPNITMWNRVEGRPRTQNFERALRGEFRDALWALSKQWQTGEFQGEDAGSVILAKVHMKTTELNKFKSGDQSLTYSKQVPLEVQVETQEIPFEQGSEEISLDLRLLMGRQWLKLLKKENLNLKNEYLKKYGFVIPKPENESHARKCAHIEVWQSLSAVGNVKKESNLEDPSTEFRAEGKLRNCMDGYRLYKYLYENSLHHAYDGIEGETTVLDNQTKDELDVLGDKFVDWFQKLFYQPTNKNNSSWRPSYLEYQFECSAPEGDGEKVLMADEYYHGHLDWYNLDVHESLTRLQDIEEERTVLSPENSFTLSFIPAPVTFAGMPNSRYWAMEDWRTNLGAIKPNTTDINQLMVLDFALNYANDWFLLPYTLPVGSIANVAGLMVTNVFGENVWINAAGSGRDEDWQRWSMFHLNTRGSMNVPSDLSLVLLPAASKSLEGRPLEEVFLMRDEVSNMVWGIETKIPLATGKSKRGKEAALELRAKLQQFVSEDSIDINTGLSENEAKIRYQIVNSVPEQWIPFIPVHKDNDKREIQLQRAAMPRILEGMNTSIPPKKIEPRTSLLRNGLDGDSREAYFIHEEEVPRAGIRIIKSFQRTRWTNGKVFNWIGYKKEVGRGEGYSGLAFDQIVEKKDK
ncbi:hypothetical protein E7Z59_11620 [Robertkochia marina]|uniref:Uncharacterized protein n=1 Tax=Robertkochia marina TaxID=1227945 RepID=A0A4S3LY02_9FLAO|nr:hypothetical protein [Robertkochia marina]THD66448.1 hypothetical protein E7Z59_11620 [Robertkochia marina]TRZ44125.1 hypothetical protein D3A96_09430 [Robertkochia marina]